MRIVGVTGTNGKTSTVLALHQLGLHCGRQAVSISSEGIFVNRFKLATSVAELGTDTHSIAASIKAILETLPEDAWRIVELTSLWLDQGLAREFEFAGGVLTSIGFDHLDVHGSQEKYVATKTRFVSDLKDTCPVIVSPQTLGYLGAEFSIADETKSDPWTVMLADIENSETGHDLGPIRAALDQFSEAQNDPCFIGNVALAARCAVAIGESPEAVAESMPLLLPPPGRYCRLKGPEGRCTVIDTAHNPEAVSAALKGAGKGTGDRLICILGAGGGRDHRKRPMMARAAADASQVVIVTDDNARSEDPSAIRQDLLEGAPNALEVSDRSDAIGLGLSMLEAGDGLVILGMGEDQWLDPSGAQVTDRDCVLSQAGWNQTSAHWPTIGEPRDRRAPTLAQDKLQVAGSSRAKPAAEHASTEPTGPA